MITREQIETLKSGIDSALGAIEDALEAQVYAEKLPIVGDKLSAAFQEGKDALKGIRAVEDKIVGAINDILYVVDNAQGIAEAYVEDTINAALKTLGVGENTVQALVNGTEVTLTFSTHQHYKYEQSLATDLGLPGLNLKTGGMAAASLDYDFNFTVGADIAGFFVQTDGSQPELSLGLTASTPDFGASTQLGFMNFSATDRDSTLDGYFAVDLKDADNDGKLRLSELNSDFIDATFSGVADIGVHLDANMGDAALPKASADLTVDWSFNNSVVDVEDQNVTFGALPVVKFENVHYDFGTVVEDFVKPILQKLEPVLEPINQALAVLRTDISFLKKLPQWQTLFDRAGADVGGKDASDGNITLLDFVKIAVPDQNLVPLTQFISIVDDVVAWAEYFGDLELGPDAYSVDLDVGSFQMLSDIRDTAFKLAEAAPTVIKGAQDLTAFLAGLNTGSWTQADPETGQTGQDVLEDMLLGDSFSLPILTNPASAFSLLVGGDAKLFSLDLPAMSFDLPSQDLLSIPIFAGLDVKVQGALGLAMDLAFGYDTRGLRQFVASDLTDYATVLNGFYVSDVDGDGVDVPEAVIKAALNLFVNATIGVASAGGGGGIEGTVTLDLNDHVNGTPDDGRIYLDEMAQSLLTNPFRIFDASGLVTAGLAAFVKVGGYDIWRFTAPRITLAEFNFSDDPATATATEPPPPPVLGTLSNGLLTLNIGARAGERGLSNNTDGAETLAISGTGGGVAVQGFGRKQSFTGVTGIVGDGGAQNDEIILDPGTTVAATLSGGAGMDYLFAGAGADSLDGGADRDFLEGHDGDDTLLGGDGDDVLDGGAGADSIDGGAGIDVLTYESSTTAVTIDIAAGTVSGGDADGDVFTGIEVFEGSNLADAGDRITGSAGDDAAFGLAGDDQLDGKGGDDFLSGGAGNDTLDGGTGADTLAGGTGEDLYYVDDLGDLADDAYAGPAGGKDLVIASVDHTLTAEIEDLTLVGSALRGTGNALANVIRGTGGDNVLDGAGGADTLHGGVGNDTYGFDSLDDRLVDGFNEGIDEIRLQTQTLADSTVFSLGADGLTNIENLTLVDGAHAIVVRGNALANVLVGNSADDGIYGLVGSDTLRGGAGNDTLDGGTEIDVLDGGAGDDVLHVGNVGGGDTLTGGAGSDIFSFYSDTRDVYGAWESSASSPTNPVTITDFQGGGTAGGDFLKIRVPNAFLVFAGERAFDIANTAAFQFPNQGDGLADVIYDHQGGNTRVAVDVNDDGVFGEKDLLVVLQGTHTLTAADFTETFNAQRGTAGADRLEGAEDADRLYGIAGNDTLLGYGGDDYAEGDAGDDSLLGGDGSDWLRGGAGNDTLDGGDGDDSGTPANGYQGGLYGGAGDDSILGGAGNDNIYGGESSSDEADGNDTIDAGDGHDQVNAGAGADLVRGGAGSDVLYGEAGDDRLEGGDGADALYGGLGNDTLDGGDGDDLRLSGDDGDDLVLGGAGNDRLYGEAGDDRLEGGSGNDTLEGAGGGDTLLGGEGDDDLSGDGVYADASGAAKGNVLDGGAGNDTLRLQSAGATAGDTLTGGTGDDLFDIQTRPDLSASGTDAPSLITDFEGAGVAGGDRLKIAVYQNYSNTPVAQPLVWAGQASFGTDGRTLGNGGDGLIDVQYEHRDGQTLLAVDVDDDGTLGAGDLLVRFDGTLTLTDGDFVDSFSARRGSAGNDSLDGGPGPDILYGLGGDDTLVGGGGNDALNGGAGNDSQDGGDGRDTLTGGGGNDTLDGGDGIDDLRGGDGDDVLNGGDGDDYVTDYSSLSIGLHGEAGNDTLNGGAGNDLLDGGTGDDRLNGEDGGDRLAGGDGRDTLDGGAGNDWLDGNDGDDRLDGGVGSDNLNGGAGNDSLYGGDGNDDLSGGEGDDALYGEAGNDMLWTDVGRDSLDGGIGNDTLMAAGTGGGRLTGGAGSDLFQISNSGAPYDPSTSAAALVITDFDESAGGDLLTLTLSTVGRLAFAGEGTIDAGSANDGLVDVAYHTAGGNTRVEVDLNDDGVIGAADAVFELEGIHTLTETNFRDTFSVRRGTAGADSLLGTAAGDLIYGVGGDDTILGTDGSDTLVGGAGNDSLDGGNDIDLLEGGDGDDVIDGGAGADHGYWSNMQYRYGLYGGAGNDTLMGGSGNDQLDGGTGNDRLDGGTEDDLLDGGAGDDTLLGGDGRDGLYGGTGNDSLDGGDGADNLSGNDGDDALSAGAGNDTLYGDDGNDTLLGGDGADRLDAGLGDDRLEGGAENDSLDGGAGADLLLGGAGNDTLDGGSHQSYYGTDGADTLDGGDGNDLLVVNNSGGGDRLTGGAGTDVFLFREPRSPAEVKASTAFQAVSPAGSPVTITDFTPGTDTLKIAVAGGNLAFAGRIPFDIPLSGPSTGLPTADDGLVDVFYDWFTADSADMTRIGVDLDDDGAIGAGDMVIQLQGRHSLTAADFTETFYAQRGTAGDDSLRGTTAAETVYGVGGNDTIEGLAGNDTLFGGAGNDSLDGGEGSDALEGGIGNDSLDGGEGNDAPSNAYSYGDRSAGLFGGAGNDLLRGGAGDDALFGEADNDTLKGEDGDDALDGGDGADSLGGGFGLDRLDGGAGNDSLDGGADDDTLNGGLGDDSLFGSVGDDRLDGDTGNDTLDGGLGRDSLYGGEGMDVFVYRSPDDGGDEIMSFDTGTFGDRIDLTPLLAGIGYSGSDPLGDGVIRLTDAGPATVTVEVLSNGSYVQLASVTGYGGGFSAQTLAGNLRFAANQAPQAEADREVTVDEDSAAVVLNIAAPTDADGDTLTVLITGLPNAGFGTVRLASGEAVSYNDLLTPAQLAGLTFTPSQNANGAAGALTYTVGDGKGGAAAQTITFDIQPVNDQPTASGDAELTVSPDQPAVWMRIGYPSDADGDELTIKVTGLPTGGTVHLNERILAVDDLLTASELGALTFTVGAQTGRAAGRFTYEVQDGHGGQATGAVDIKVDIPLPTLEIAVGDAVRSESTGGETTFTFLITRSGDTSDESSVDWSVSGFGIDAADGADFGGTLPSGTVRFAVGESSQTVSVSVSGDSALEPDENFVVDLANPVGATLTGWTAVGTILNDDAPAGETATTLDIAPETGTVASGDEGAALTFLVTRSGDLSGSTTVSYAVAGTGPNPVVANDFTGGSLPQGTVIFAPGEQTARITVAVQPDGSVEADEMFTVTLTSAAGGTIRAPYAVGVIRNDDTVPAGPATTLSIAAEAGGAAYEGNKGTAPVTFLVTRSGDLSGTTTVAYAVAGSGLAPAAADDFAGTVLPHGTVTFAPGEETARITVTFQGDTVVEGDETFTVTLSDATGAAILTPSATGTIRNEDVATGGGSQPIGDETVGEVVVHTRQGTAPSGINLPFVETEIDQDVPQNDSGDGVTVALMRDGGNAPLLQATVSPGGRITAYGPQSTVDSGQLAGIVESMLATNLPNGQGASIKEAIQGFANGAGNGGQMTVRALTPIGTGAITITGSSGTGAPRETLIFNMSSAPGGSVILNEVDVVVVVGSGSFTGGAGNSLTIGDSSSQHINLGPGDDTTRGGGGNDVVASTTGRDLLSGDEGNDTIHGGADEDTLLGGDGNDLIGGGTGDDLISGDDGNDVLVGEDGSDAAIGGAGDDVLFGMAGADLLTGDAGIDTIVGGDGNDSILGGTGHDLIGGGDGDDLIDGGDENDTLIGEAGNDTLFGGAGDDLLWGFGGDDWLIGGDGRDTFAFMLDGGNDLVFGFNPDEDLLGFGILGMDLAQLMANARTVGGNTVFTLLDKSTITVVGVTGVTNAWFS
ncbi:Calx-beta domain-containing protein [Roseomonas genomospecies 6]|nr:Calx-beta domain-containing protein [Roseomonas genomospecies 6]